MALTIDVSTRQVDLGDTKVLQVTPKDADGAALTPATLEAVFTPPSGEATTKALADFDLSGGVYSVRHTFDVAGIWRVRVAATDAQGNTEVETGDLEVVG